MLKVWRKRILRIKINHSNSEHGEFLDFVKLLALGSVYEHKDAVHV